MKSETNSVDYGVYIDREKAVLIALDRIVHEEPVTEAIIENEDRDKESRNVSRQEHVQNRKHEEIRKFCKAIIERLVNVNKIVIFGPSTMKFELQKEMSRTPRLKNMKEEVVTTDFMDNDAALRFVKEYYTVILAAPQMFNPNQHHK